VNCKTFDKKHSLVAEIRKKT